MKYVLIVALSWLTGVGVALAYTVVPTEISTPYEVVPITAGEHNQQALLGTLEGYPIMYELDSDEPFDLSLQLVTKNTPADPDFSLMVVRANDDGGGVTEVVRLPAGEADWTVRKDSVFGMSFKESKVLKSHYEPGTYRIEVSTPFNEGAYMLMVGSTADHLGYFETLGQVRAVQKHFGYSVVRMFGSSYVYYPLGIVFLLWVIRRTWRFRKSISNA